MAIFLSWNYTSVLFRTWCEKPGHLIVEYYPADEDGPINAYRMAVILDNKVHPMDPSTPSANGSQRILTGRVALNARLSAEILSANAIDFDVPTAEEEPFHTGSAEAFKRIVRACR